MSTYNFSPVSWNPGDDITTEKLNQHGENERWLKDAIPEITFSTDASGADVFSVSGLKVYATNARLPINKTSVYSHVDVEFPAGLFQGNPIVIATPGKRDIDELDVALSVRAIGTSGNAGNWPRSDGVRVVGKMLPPATSFKLTIAVHIIAIGQGGV